MSAQMSIRACGECGAVVAVTSSEGGGSGIGNEQQHAKWHENLARSIADQIAKLGRQNPGRRIT